MAKIVLNEKSVIEKQRARIFFNITILRLKTSEWKMFFVISYECTCVSGWANECRIVYGCHHEDTGYWNLSTIVLSIRTWVNSESTSKSTDTVKLLWKLLCKAPCSRSSASLCSATPGCLPQYLVYIFCWTCGYEEEILHQEFYKKKRSIK